MTADDSQSELRALFQAIAQRNAKRATRLLAARPSLARVAMAVGATREAAAGHFFEEISHYAYAGDTALHLAAAAHQPSIATQLLANGASVDAKNRRGAQPLHYATDGSPGSPAWDPEAQAAVVTLLIEAGANPNTLDKSGVAPLHRAVRTRSAAAVDALLRHGATPRLKNRSGSTPLHLAVQNTGRSGSGSVDAREQQGQVIRLLLEHGARPSDRDENGKSVTAATTIDWIRALLASAKP